MTWKRSDKMERPHREAGPESSCGGVHRYAGTITGRAGSPRPSIRQFLDIGSGLPTVQNTHEVAQAVDPACRVVYADNDPVVLSHARALLSADRVAVASGDLREPGGITGSAAVAPGSYLVLSTASGEEAVASDMQTEYTASSTWNHSREVIRSFFAGTELMAPGLADAGEWLPGATAVTPVPKSIRVIAGIGRKP